MTRNSIAMTSDELVSILSRAFEEEGSLSGETPLTHLLRIAFSDPTVQSGVEHLLGEAAEKIRTAEQWQAFSYLVGRLNAKNEGLGANIEERLADGILDDPESRLWAARSAFDLGATLSNASYRNLEENVQRHPILWLELMFDTLDPRVAAERFRKLSDRLRLTIPQSVEAVRLFTRWASGNNVPSTSPLSDFLHALPAQEAVSVARKLERRIGPSYLEANLSRLAQSNQPEIHGETPLSGGAISETRKLKQSNVALEERVSALEKQVGNLTKEASFLAGRETTSNATAMSDQLHRAAADSFELKNRQSPYGPWQRRSSDPKPRSRGLN